MRSPSMSTSKRPSRPFAGSTTRAPLSSCFMIVKNIHHGGHGGPNLLDRDCSSASSASSVVESLGASVPLLSTHQQVQNRHPHGHTVCHLLEDHGVWPIGHLGRDLHAAVHRTRVHDDDVRLRALDALRRHPEDAEVLPQGRKKCPLQPLLLNPPHHD